MRASRVAMIASLATTSARSRAMVAAAAGSGAPAAGSSGTPTLAVSPPSWFAVPARGRRSLAPPPAAGQPATCAQRRSAGQRPRPQLQLGRRPPTAKWLLHALPVRRSSPGVVGSQRPAVGRRPTKQRAQALRRVELEHPAVPLRPDVEGAKAAQGHAVAAFQRRIDLVEEPSTISATASPSRSSRRATRPTSSGLSTRSAIEALALLPGRCVAAQPPRR